MSTVTSTLAQAPNVAKSSKGWEGIIVPEHFAGTVLLPESFITLSGPYVISLSMLSKYFIIVTILEGGEGV